VIVRFTRLATTDLLDARDAYAEKDPDLAIRFVDHLDVVIDRMRTFPLGAPPVDGFPGVRRARMRLFPYGIFYRVDDGILVLRVLHTRRDVDDLR
jgi:toxin ParE1/3/4